MVLRITPEKRSNNLATLKAKGLSRWGMTKSNQPLEKCCPRSWLISIINLLSQFQRSFDVHSCHHKFPELIHFSSSTRFRWRKQWDAGITVHDTYHYHFIAPHVIVHCPISKWAIFFKLTYLQLEVNPNVIMHFSIEYCNMAYKTPQISALSQKKILPRGGG